MFGKNKDLKTEVVEPKVKQTANKNTSASVMKKLFENKMMRNFIILIVFIIVFLIIMFLITVIFPRKLSYGGLETTMENAAKKYFADNPNTLPQEEMASVTISAERLEELNYMKPLKNYLSSNAQCSGSVTVTKAATTHNYVGYLDCGDAYVTQEFYKKITSSENIVTSGYGIYNINNEFVYRGEVDNNYVSVDDMKFRIVKVNSNNEVVLILDNGIRNKTVWDDRYNNTVEWDSGINDYSVSRVKEYLKGIYNRGSKETINLSDKTKSKLVSFNSCISGRNADDASKDNSVECSKMLDNQFITLLTVSDYMNASNDVNCVKTTDKSCQNYNYLKTSDVWWLITPNASNDFDVYQVNYGIITTTRASRLAKVRPVIHVSSTAKYEGGTGTINDPYKFR